MGKVIQFENKRRFPRREVDKPAFCQIGNSGFSARVKNISAGGMFIVPEDGYVDGVWVHESDILDHLDEGDHVEISCNGAVSQAVVKWLGNGQPGFGVQYVMTDMKLAA